jgi:hypothetical protein
MNANTQHIYRALGEHVSNCGYNSKILSVFDFSSHFSCKTDTTLVSFVQKDEKKKIV